MSSSLLASAFLHKSPLHMHRLIKYERRREVYAKTSPAVHCCYHCSCPTEAFRPVIVAMCMFVSEGGENCLQLQDCDLLCPSGIPVLSSNRLRSGRGDIEAA
ncbi:hypothetical protein GOODEAATRI_020902 [Goodea atripinnis]|uniref:Uncharacterized protein n=1 Tax=Goodea atripinnis TaxID=208336 RepID=A0ABV0N353_9TELE